MTGHSELPPPKTIRRGAIIWPFASIIAAIHLLAMLALLPWFFSWAGVIAMMVGVFFFGQGINLCYHRLLAHRSFQVPKWFERVLVVLAMCCLEDSPGKWVATHRFHHGHSDEQDDPHSPLVSFLWAHIGWLLVINSESRSFVMYRRYAPDIFSDPFYMAIEKHLLWFWVYVAHAVIYFLIGLFSGYLAFDTWSLALQFGLSLLIWGVFVRTVLVWHITWSVNSVTHLFGYRNYETGEGSRNNWLIGLIGAGEGWHNNHHHDPVSASVQHRWWEVDLTYYCIRVLEWLGLATHVVRPRHLRQRIQAENKQTTSGT